MDFGDPIDLQFRIHLLLTGKPWKSDLWRTQRKMITVVRRLRDKEVQIYHADEQLAFQTSSDSTLALQPYVDKGWFSYYGNMSSDSQRKELEKFLSLPKSSKREVESFSADIQSGQYSWGPVARIMTGSCATDYGMLGFDDKFLPVCILSTVRFRSENISHSEQMEAIFGEAIFVSSDRVASYNPKMSQTEGWEVPAIINGNLKVISNRILVFTITERLTYGPEESSEMSACIVLKPPLVQERKPRNRDTHSAFDSMRHVYFRIMRTHPTAPWTFTMRIGKTEDPLKAPRCSQCSLENRSLIDVDDSDFDQI